MKKFLLSIVAVFAFAAMVNAQQTQTYNFSATVKQFIQVNPESAIVDISNVVIDPASQVKLPVFPVLPAFKANFKDNVYANCPFSISYSGDPILSREEVNGNGTDRLQTNLVIRNEINGFPMGQEPGYERWDMTFLSDAEGAVTGTYENQTCAFENTPHDGEVATTVWFTAVLPHMTPEFGVDNTYNQSADAGTYTSQIVATYAVIPWE